MGEPSVLPTRPTDGGWAWMVLVGSFLVRMLTEGFVASMGVFFVEWQSFFNTSAASVSWAGSALTMTWFVSGKFHRHLVYLYSFCQPQFAPICTLDGHLILDCIPVLC